MLKTQEQKQKTYRFRRWDGNAYSAFNSLKKKVTIGVLSLTCSLAIVPKCSEAQTDRQEHMQQEDLDEVVVSAQRAPVLYSEMARVVHVISQEEIASAPVSGIDGLLEYAAGIDIRQRGGMDVQADISLRGSSSDQVAILLNGINITDPQTGHHNLNLPIDLSAIQRIEILQGPAARIFGANAFSGAINIITSPEHQNNQTEISLTGGEYGYYRAAANLQQKAGNTQHFASISHKASDGYTDNTDFKNSNVFYHGRLSLKKHSFELQGGYNTKEFGALAFYTPAYPNQFEATRTQFAGLKYSTGQKIKFNASGYWRRLHDRFELFRYESPEWYKNHNYHMSDIAGAQASLLVYSSMGKTSIGLEARDERIKSNVLGYEMDKPEAVPGEEGAQFTKSADRQSMNLYVEHSLILNRWSFSAGALAYWHSSLEGAHFFPGADISYAVSSALRLYATANHSLRVPTFTDLFYEGPTNIGNPNLKPEESTSFEGGIKLQDRGIQGHALVYRRLGRNVIDWVKADEEKLWQAQNLTEVNTTGIEISMSTQPAQWFEAMKFVKQFRLSYNWANMDKESGALISRYALDYLRHKLDAAANFHLWKKLGLSTLISWQDRDGTYLKYEDGQSTVADYKPFALVNARLQWQEKHWMAYMEANNLFDEEYFDFGNVIQPGRWLIAGVKIRLAY